MLGKLLLVAGVVTLSFCIAPARGGEPSRESRRKTAEEQYAKGMFRDAAKTYRDLALNPAEDPTRAALDLQYALECYTRVSLFAENEALLEEAAEVWSGSWRMLSRVAYHYGSLSQLVHYADGKYIRAQNWGNNNFNTAERDRAVAMGLMLRAEKLLDSEADRPVGADKAAFYRQFADILMRNRERTEWRLTALTNLVELPDYEDYNTFYGGDNRFAPVDADGNPVYYSMPESWAAAKNDGERWRWLLGRMAEYGAGDEADLVFAQFLLRQFGVQTMNRGYSVSGDAAFAKDTGPFAVRTLKENETVARLANGVKRFELPGEFDYVGLLRRLYDKPNRPQWAAATRVLAFIFENRQQYPKAATLWRELLKSGKGNAKEANDAVNRITGKNGRLEAGPIVPAGTAPRIPFLYRNGEKAVLTAYRLDEKKLIDSMRDGLKQGKDNGARSYMRPERIGQVAIGDKGEEYFAGKVAEWDVKLNPLPDYYSTRTQIELPFSDAGCYLVEAAMEGGNVSRVVVVVADLSLVRKSVAGRELVYVADAASGEPVAGATVSFFGYSIDYDTSGRRNNIKPREFAEHTDADGLIVLDAARLSDSGGRNNIQWLITAQTDDGRLAYLGFDPFWYGRRSEPDLSRLTSFVITDRPVYRPDQTVNFKVWIGRAAYGGTESTMNGASVMVRIQNPRGEEVYKKTLTADEYGGVADQLVLGTDAPLGGYFIQVDQYGGGQFRLEEYKKPEYEVTVETPDKALTLGDATKIKVKAAYYYGAPVTDAKVSYKVVRNTFRDAWLPPWRWDWLYGSGCWLTSYNYSWFPGWDDWALRAPGPGGMPFRFEQPELVAEGEGTLDADGLFQLNLDTASAKELFGDRDHEYAITVEVTDKSRRTIVGGGRVVASRKPFSATVWADRGYYLAGQEINVRAQTRLPLGGGVKTEGKATLYRVRYNPDGTPSESEEQSWDVVTDASGAASLTLKADKPGQYRLSFNLLDADGNQEEGAAVLTVRGEGGDGDFRFADLELVPDKFEYRPGDTVKLAVNAGNKSGVVLLFVKAERAGTGSGKDKSVRPSVLRLENGSRVVDIPVTQSDQPNFFCEAVTIHKGKLYVQTREIFVPPVDKTLNVEVSSDKDSYSPGGKAAFSVAVTDADGKPVRGQCVVSVYDKSVEYIAGGSNVGDIRSHFWNWKRYYQGSLRSSLSRYGYRLEKKGDVRWEPIGVFGAQEADWNDDMVYTNGVMQRNEVMYEQMEVAEAAPAMASGSTAQLYSVEGDAARPPAPMAAALGDEKITQRRLRMPSQTESKMQENAYAGGGAAMQEPVVRSEFADTALWIAALETDENGHASFEVDMPENLTAWKARTWTMASGTRVGDGERTVETRKNVIVRPQAPRFFTQKDQVILSANLHNYLPRAKDARAELVLEGGVLEAAEGVELVKNVWLPANGEARVDWLVDARRPGEARIVMKLLTDEESDAAEIKLPVIVHGARRVENYGGVLRGDEQEIVLKIRVPEERLPDQSVLELSFSPTIASAMLEALPYLIEYPYGCTEQTLNRFLPVVMTRKYLERMGVSLADAGKALAVPADPKSVEWKQRFGDSRNAWRKSPVFDDAELEKMVKQGVERLGNMQNADGGWGWFSGSGERSWPHTSAVVMHGMLAAKDNGMAIPPAVLEKGMGWLRRYRDKQIDDLKLYVATEGEDERKGKAQADNLDAFVNLILAGQGHFSPDMRDFLYRDRLDLSLSGLSMLGIALHAEKATNFLEVVLGNLDQYVEKNDDIGTAWLRTTRSGWWWWYNDAVEMQAWYLKLLSRVDPTGARASGVAKHLLRNRKNGSYWQSTRDTAYAIEALTEYAVASGEATPDMTVTLFLDGKQVMERKIAPADILKDNRFRLDGLAVETGEHELRIVRSGAGNVYYSGRLDVFSLEDPIAKAGLELKVERTFYKLIREEKTVDRATSSGVAAAGQVEHYRRERMSTPFDTDPTARIELRPGDLVEVELTVEAANDFEYLVFEDMKAAGLEAVELRSGYNGNRLGAYVEYRDQKVVLFVRYLPKGTYSVSYRFRAEVPGWFSALPTFGGGMYATDLFTNSDEMKVKIVEDGVFE